MRLRIELEAETPKHPLDFRIAQLVNPIFEAVLAELKCPRPHGQEDEVSKRGEVAIAATSDLIEQLRYIADSPAQEHGGFHEQTVSTALMAIKRIDALEKALHKAHDAVRHHDTELTHGRCGGKIRVLDWRGSASRELRFEAYCEGCGTCDPNGWPTLEKAIAEARAYFDASKREGVGR